MSGKRPLPQYFALDLDYGTPFLVSPVKPNPKQVSPNLRNHILFGRTEQTVLLKRMSETGLSFNELTRPLEGNVPVKIATPLRC